MARRWLTGRRIAWATVLLAPVALVAAAANSGHVPNQCAGYGQPGQEACHYLFVTRNWVKWADALIKNDDNDKVVVALGTAAIALFTFTLWRSTNRLWLQNETNFSRLERAYIFCGPSDQRIIKGDGAHINLTTTNFGNTLGIVKEVVGEFIAGPPAPRSKPQYASAPHITDLVIMPKTGPVIQPFDVHSPSIDEPLFVAGYVKYIDVLRQEHISRFCVKMDAGIIEPVGPPAWNDWD